MKQKLLMCTPYLLWTIIVILSLYLNLVTIENNNQNTLKSIGGSFFKEIETTRLWNARHGGVYVPITEQTQPNPYLKVANRDIVAQNGMKLTKINPAFMTRQIADIAKQESNIQYHITSLKPIRPANSADAWETKTLKSFRSGIREYLEYLPQERVYRYMAPLFVKRACLDCHAEQGYRLNEIRGGISVTIPSKTYVNAFYKSKQNLILIHFAAFGLGILFLFLFQRFRDKQIFLLNQKNEQLVHEIDERKKIEKSLEQAKSVAESANKAKSIFLSNMSHELRTPLNAILGFSQLLMRGKNLESVQRENLSIIRRSGEHLLNLINNVLDLSKIESGHFSLYEKNFDLHKLLHDVEDMCRLKAEQKQLKMIVERRDDVPQFLLADELRLRQILLNLINNAIKFTQEGGICVRLKTNGLQEIEEATFVELNFEVEDTGPGIAPQDLPSLFEAFVQTKTGKESLQGTGLGLSISRKFVRAMGGEMTVRSTLEKGTTFTFTINGKVVDKADKDRSVSTRRVIGLKEDQPEYKILIVDDRETNRRLLIQLLSPLGFSLKEAENGKEALEIFETWDPHLIWMNMRMPVMDGYEATKRIKSTTKGQTTCVVALTASTFEEEQVIVLSTGCDDFLRKPFKEMEIFQTMEKHIGVRYLYAEDGALPETEQNNSHDLTAEEVGQIPSDMLETLEQAIERVDTDLMNEVLARIHHHAPDVSEKLRKGIEDFEYDRVVMIIQDALSKK